MTKTKVDYWGLRHIFRKNGNGKKFDKVILHVINSLNADFIRQEVFRCVEFIEEF